MSAPPPFLDTSILVYAALQPDRRSETARRIVGAGGIVSVHVLNEFATVAHRKLRRPWPEIQAALTAIRALCPDTRPITLALHEAALVLAARYRCTIDDALILAAALDARCDTLLSEDLQDGQVIEGRLTIRDPFAASR